jgi:hypothetical protein
VYTDRGDFPEYEVLVREMPRYLPALFVTNDELRRGALASALEQALAAPFPAEPPLDGAEVAAQHLIAALG